MTSCGVALVAARARARRGRAPARARGRRARVVGAACDVDAEARSGLDRLPDGDRLGLPLRLDRRRRPGTRSRAPSRGRSSRRRGSPFDRRRRLQARRRVDDVAGDHALALRAAARRARRAPRPCSRRSARAVDVRVLLVQLGDRVADRERRPDRALGVVLVRDRRAEDRHHRVADELLDRPAVPLELRRGGGRGTARGSPARPRGPAARRCAVNPTRSANRTVTTFRSSRAEPAASANADPQFAQNRASSGFPRPQLVQVRTAGDYSAICPSAARSSSA